MIILGIDPGCDAGIARENKSKPTNTRGHFARLRTFCAPEFGNA